MDWKRYIILVVTSRSMLARHRTHPLTEWAWAVRIFFLDALSTWSLRTPATTHA